MKNGKQITQSQESVKSFSQSDQNTQKFKKKNPLTEQYKRIKQFQGRFLFKATKNKCAIKIQENNERNKRT